MTTLQLLWTLRYVVRNPVESGLCAEPAERMRSSYRASTGDVKPPRVLALNRLVTSFADEPRLAMFRFRAHAES